MRAVEKYYSIQETALLLSCCDRTVKERMASGEYTVELANGETVGPVNLGSATAPDYRIPASGINASLARRRVFTREPGITARTTGELRRKAALQPVT